MKHMQHKTRKKLNKVLLCTVALVLMSAMVLTGCGDKKAPAAGTEQTYPADYQAQFSQVWAKNNDFKGYLTLEGTALATTVVQGTDNETYLKQDIDGREGCNTFLDYRADLTVPGSQLLIHLPDASRHEMFGELTKYKNLEYYKEHPVITFNTVHEDAKFKVFSVVVLPSGSEEIPYQSCLGSADPAQLEALIALAREYSLLGTTVDVTRDDTLLTIVSEDLTLKDESGKNARVLVFARKVRSGESEAVDTDKAVIQPNTHMSEAWYNQILREQYISTVLQQIRAEAAGWFTANELSQIADSDLERQLNIRMTEYKKYLNEEELKLSAEEKAYLYEKRKFEAENPALELSSQHLTAKVGDKVELTVKRTPADEKATFTWKSSDDGIVSITSTGDKATLNIRKKGTATITVTSGNTSVTCKVEAKDPEQLVLNPASKTIMEGEYFQVTASSEIAKGSSSNTSVAKVTYNGKVATVTGVAPGKATITLTNKDGVSATCSVTVDKYTLKLDNTSLTLEKGNRYTVKLTRGEAVNWYTDNSSIAWINVVDNGKAVQIEAVGAGTTTVTATARNGAQASCKVTVTDNSVAISNNYFDMVLGDIRALSVLRGTVTKWTSSDENIIRLYPMENNTYVQLEAVGYGYATIRAEGKNGSFAICDVMVAEPRETLTITPYSMTMTVGDIRNITVTSGKASDWISESPDVAQVYVIGDGSMAQVEGKRAGTAVIKVKDAYGAWLSCEVTVNPTVSKLEIGPRSVYMDVGDWVDVSVISGRAVSWASSDESIVRVYGNDDTSKVSIKGESAGTAQVIAYAADGSTATCTVTVNEPYYGVDINTYSMSLSVGDMGTLSVVSGSAHSWYSDNPDVADVYVIGDGSSAQVEARSAGSAVIEVYDAQGACVSCVVTVSEKPAPVVQPLEISHKNLNIVVGEWYDIKVTSGYAVEWDSTNSDVCGIYTVDGDLQNIRIKAAVAGYADLIAYDADGCAVVCSVIAEDPYVEPEPVAEPLAIGPASQVITEGDWAEVWVVSGDAVDWNTSNPNIVRVFGTGDTSIVQIKGECAGTAEVIAYAADGSTASVTVTVAPYQE